MPYCLFLLFWGGLSASVFGGEILARDEKELRKLVSEASPGTRIVIAPGEYGGGLFFENLRGKEGLPIVLTAEDPARPPLFKGGANGIRLSNSEYVELSFLSFSGMTGNGINIDDGGTGENPAHHILLKNLKISDIGPQGNKDGIKLSGVTDFEVNGCIVEQWGTQGSGIDMVGCHRGVIENNLFKHTETEGGNGVQCKGGSSEIVIRKNRFENAGNRSVNIGGSTGLMFFRPPLQKGMEQAEARRIIVEGNTFMGSQSPVAFVGVDDALVRFNTIYRPGRWALRILQENKEEGFVPSRNGKFRDNLVIFHSAQWSAGGVNVGPGTAPESFEFMNNWWYCLDRPEQSRPSLPVQESGGTYGRDPLLKDPDKSYLKVQSGSPAARVGAEALP